LEAVYLSGVKSPLLVIVGAAGAVLLTSCTTLENRADLYSPRNYYANGPYTRMLHSGIPTVKYVFVKASVSRTDVYYQRGK
jgi:hypothetical protein